MKNGAQRQKIWVFMFSCPETRLDRVSRDHFTNCAVYCACLTLPQPILWKKFKLSTVGATVDVGFLYWDRIFFFFFIKNTCLFSLFLDYQREITAYVTLFLKPVRIMPSFIVSAKNHSLITACSYPHQLCHECEALSKQSQYCPVLLPLKLPHVSLPLCQCQLTGWLWGIMTSSIHLTAAWCSRGMIW